MISCAHISNNLGFLLAGTITGGFLGLIYSLLEYSLSNRSLPTLLILGLSIGLLIGISVSLFEILSGLVFKHRTFFQTVLIRTIIYLAIVLGWQIVINSMFNKFTWTLTFWEGLKLYVYNESFIYNLIFAFFGILLMTAFHQISKLHRKGELSNYIFGRYHQPREIDQIFLFIDLKGSTQIAEKIGNLNYGRFLQDYYAHITYAILKIKAMVYQYVGDEIVVTWPMRKGLHKNQCIQFVIEMRKTFDKLMQRYNDLYGFSPEFRAGLHGGKVLITWIGEVKKEIVYVGDVLNTTARIAEEGKKAKLDFLISGDIYDVLENSSKEKCLFYNQLQLRGKVEEMNIYSHPIR